MGSRGNRQRNSRVERSQPESVFLDLSTAGVLSDVAESPLTNHDWFYEVAEDIDQLGNDEWGSEDDLPADFVVANNPPMEYENPEDIPQMFNTVADNTFKRRDGYRHASWHRYLALHTRDSCGEIQEGAVYFLRVQERHPNHGV